MTVEDTANNRPRSQKAKVAVLRTRPETVQQDHERLMELADFRQHLDPSATRILTSHI